MAFVRSGNSGGATPFDFDSLVGLGPIGTTARTINTNKKVIIITCRDNINVTTGTLLDTYTNPNSNYNNRAYLVEPSGGKIVFKGQTSTFGTYGTIYFEVDDVIY